VIVIEKIAAIAVAVAFLCILLFGVGVCVGAQDAYVEQYAQELGVQTQEN